MKILNLLLLLTLSINVFGQSTKKEVVCVAFYNLENLFDTESSMDALSVEKYKNNDPEYIETDSVDWELMSDKEYVDLRTVKIDTITDMSTIYWDVNDEENTAEGLRQYTEEVYNDKLNQLAKVISDMGTAYTPDGPAIIGIGEIENRAVLEDLVKNEQIAERNYQVIQYNSMYSRGIDVAFLYQPNYFTPTNTEVIRLENMYYGKSPSSKVITRDILQVEGKLAGEDVIIFVNHWPSRRATSRLREEAAAALKVHVDAILKENINAKIFIMGDLNDDPISPSVKKVLDAKKKVSAVGEGDLFNPLYKDYKQGYGSLAYRGSWNLFDQIIISSAIVKDAEGWAYHDAEVMYEPYMINAHGGYAGGPNRSFGGNHYQPGGFSDHLPSLLYLTRSQRKDMDNDGIADEDDDCPKVAGVKAFKGCPDTDGDGVQDSEDECVDVAGLVTLAGCPDSDEDGVADKDDECPEEKGLLANKGCPEKDSDGDGIIDKEDDCPQTKGIASNRGCPEMKEEVKQVLQLAFDNLEFETAKSIIRKSSDDELEDLAKILKENPDMQLKITGHTDDVGNDESNMKLSKDRAEAVKARMISLGIDANRLSAFWFGETKPIASNETAEGRQKNRRVDFDIFYK